MNKKTKLELTWIGKENHPKLEPRILLEDPAKSYHAAHRMSENDFFENRLIFGDNLLALKALEQEFTGRVKCIYIDPPYNTGTAFPSYDDGIEHSLWLSMMKDRLEILWQLLKTDGVLLISINDDECHYLKVLCDNLFGREKFIANLVWNYEGNTDNQAKIINYHEYILVYSKNGEIDNPGVIDPSIDINSKLYKSEIRNTIVKNGPKNPFKSILIPKGFPASFSNGIIRSSSTNYPQYSSDIYIQDNATCNETIAYSGWSSKELLEEYIRSGFKPVKDSKNQSTIFEITKTGAIESIKKRESTKGHFISVLRGFGTTNQMRIMLSKLGIDFTYPKPVDLIAYLVEAFTSEDDWILDSFAGSGTTAHAVMKINHEKRSRRKFILVELKKETVDNVIIPRLRNVIDGNSDVGIPEHGGGFRYYKLAPSLLKKDRFDNWIINKEYNPEMLAAAMCKLEGFTYAPSETIYWMHGNSTERDYLYVTTQTLSQEQLQALSDEVGPERSLLVLCSAFRGSAEAFQNLTIKKMPNHILNRCEWDHDDYSLKVENLPRTPEPKPTPLGGLFEEEGGNA